MHNAPYLNGSEAPTLAKVGVIYGRSPAILLLFIVHLGMMRTSGILIIFFVEVADYVFANHPGLFILFTNAFNPSVHEIFLPTTDKFVNKLLVIFCNFLNIFILKVIRINKKN